MRNSKHLRVDQGMWSLTLKAPYLKDLEGACAYVYVCVSFNTSVKLRLCHNRVLDYGHYFPIYYFYACFFQNLIDEKRYERQRVLYIYIYA